MISATQDILSGLAPTVDGLNAGEWVSVTATVVQTPATFVTVRVKPNQPDTLETWINGVRQ